MNDLPDRYTLPARALHWLVALAILVALVLALSVSDGPMNPTKLREIDYHRWAGVAVILLVIARLAWRLGHRPPAMPQHMKPAEQRVALIGHGLLYVLMVAVPLGGLLFSSAAGLPAVNVAGMALPDLVAKQPREVAHNIHELHEFGAWTLIVLAALHAAVAVKHQVVDRDGLLKRMI